MNQDATTESVRKSADGKVIETCACPVSPAAKTSTRIAKIHRMASSRVYAKQAGDSVGTPKKLTGEFVNRIEGHTGVAGERHRWCPSRDLWEENSQAAYWGMVVCPRSLGRSVVRSPSSPFDPIRPILPFVLKKVLVEED